MYQATIIGAYFASVCSRGACGHIHSVFDRAMNIEITEHNTNISLLTLLCADSDVMPAALVTSMRGESWHKCCSIGGKIVFTQDMIYLDSMPFISGVSNAAIWKPIVPTDIRGLPKLTYEEIAIRCKQVDLYTQEKGIRNTDFPVMRLSDFDATRLLGMGDGLTPSGDDFLAGMLFAIHFTQTVYGKKCVYLPAIASSVLQDMAARTNQISQHFLRYAAEGLWGRATERFMLAFFGNDDAALHSAIQEKAAYGATSGIDEIQGIMFGLCEAIRLFEGE